MMRAPSPVEIARSFHLTPSQTEHILRQLAREADALVPLPGSAYIWMAEPFSAVPTSFLIGSGEIGSGERRWVGELHLGRAGHPGPAPARRMGPDRVPRLRCPAPP
jgi:hypothetical protein